VRCGSIPEDRAAAVLKRLLHAQHQADPYEGRSFGLDAETGDLVFVASMELRDLSAPELLARLRGTFGALTLLRNEDRTPMAAGSMREVVLDAFAS
jgi:hypothetical protein